MKIYVTQADDPSALADGEPAGRKRLVVANYDFEDLTFDTSTLSPFTTVSIDELVSGNKALMLDAKQTLNQFGRPSGQRALLPKYYWDGTHLFARGGWAPYNPFTGNVYTPTTDVQQTLLALRTILAIYNDIKALTGTQQGNIDADLFGVSLKYLFDAGRNAASIAVLDWAIRFAGAAPSSVTEAKFRAAAMYTQDNPTYLVNPSFDTSINVPGIA